MITRRQLLSGLIASGSVAALSAPLTAGAGEDRLLISAARKTDGSYILVGCTERGTKPFEIPLPGRGHATAVSPDGTRAVHVARRPGRFLLVVDLVRGTLEDMLGAPDGRHFYGHAGFSADGALLFTTENDYENGRGVIGVWARDGGYRRVAEWESHDIGPHDLALMPDGGTIAIANGGILTHPDSGRAKLNIADMRPSLTFLDTRNGSLLRRVTLPPALHKNSIRHLDCGPDGTVLFGMQYQGAKADAPPLVGSVDPDGICTLFDAPEIQTPRLKGYCADVAIDASGRFGASTFPRGDRIAIWSVPDGRLVGLKPVRDSAGVTSGRHAGGFRFTTGLGRLVAAQTADGGRPFDARTRHFSDLAFDNHVTSATHRLETLRGVRIP